MISTPLRTFSINSPIRACRLRRDDLKRLYRVINERQGEHRELMLNLLTQQNLLVQQPQETPQQFQERRSRIANSFKTTINITGPDNEIVTGDSEEFLDNESIPDDVQIVYYTTVAGPQGVGIPEQQQRCRAIILLDFSRPTLLDFSKLAALPTANASTITLSPHLKHGLQR